MTKLMEWLGVVGALAAVWFVLVSNKAETDFTKQYFKVILYSPVILLFLFGLYAATVVLYRTFTFNNCEDAAAELQDEIKAAKKDLRELGFKFKTEN